MPPVYIRVARFWSKRRNLSTTVEVQMHACPDEEVDEDVPRERYTSLQFFGRTSGAAMSGQGVFDPDQLAALYDAIGTRLTELGHPSAPPHVSVCRHCDNIIHAVPVAKVPSPPGGFQHEGSRRAFEDQIRDVVGDTVWIMPGRPRGHTCPSESWYHEPRADAGRPGVTRTA